MLAEGIETPAHLDLAVSAGATLGQGWLFGKPTEQLLPASTHLPPAAHDTHVPATEEADRQFDYLLTYGRDLTVQIARTIMDRFTTPETDMASQDIETPPVTSDEFSDALLGGVRKARNILGWTQADLAQRTHGVISTAALAGYESGHRRLRINVAWTLAAALGLDLSTLIGRAEHTASEGGVWMQLTVWHLLHTTDHDLAPVRRWLQAAHPEPVGLATKTALTNDAITALATLMRITNTECRQRLAPYIVARPHQPDRAPDSD